VLKKLLVLASLAFGVLAIGGGLYARLGSGGPAPTVTFYGDGQRKNATVYVEGVKDGPSEQWYSDGLKEWEGFYDGGFRSGAWTFWTEDGQVDLERSGRYEAGQRVGGL
jgi:antitoxin component YwqK of YwqJK toxin-antitoxin module